MRLPLLASLVLTLSSISALAYTQGINCQGSILCRHVRNDFQYVNLIGAFQVLLSHGLPGLPGGPIDPARIYHKGQTIACAAVVDDWWAPGAICVFLQGNVPAAGMNGSVIIDRIHDLFGHACGFCGSVPVSGDNDPEAQGLLTVNYVDRPPGGCNGVCDLEAEQAVQLVLVDAEGSGVEAAVEKATLTDAASSPLSSGVAQKTAL